jgi:eukaryotic-like serine/threonine-protein kinase
VQTNFSSSDTATPSTDDRIDVICDAFEDRLIRGERPQISEYVSQAGQTLSADLFSELLLVEIEYRSRSGEPVSKAEYLQRFPEFADAIETVGHSLSWTTSEKVSAPASGVDERIHLDRYILSDRIGSGAAGEVWKARDPRLGRTVAVKIPHSRRQSEEERRRFVREGRAAAQLRHPNIVTVHEASHEGATAFIIADFIDGRDLRQHLTEARPPYRTAAELCEKIARALHYAHEAGVVHRDLKPANIILDCRGEPHITDFGLAKWTGDARDMTISGQMLGTPAYMSPEQARGDSARVDARADVFALGVMLYEMLTGRCPFTGGQAAVLNDIINAPVERPSAHDRRIPRDLETICLKAIEKAPERRYATAAELAADLRRYLDGDPIRARRPKPQELAWRWVRRHPALVAALLLGATAAFALGMNKRLAHKNYELLGVKPVALTTDPPGAYTVFVPINSANGRPDPESDGVVRGVTPIECELRPGDYLVVAALADGRFHEVIRHVPSDSETIPYAYNHQFWTIRDDDVVKLPAIAIPARDVTRGMRLVSRSLDAPAKDENLDLTSEVLPFYIDPNEYTWGQWKSINNSKAWPKSVRNNPPSPTDWAPRDYERAVHCAERAGKRLITIEEYDYAAAAVAQGEGETSAEDGEGSTQLPFDLTPEIPEWTQSPVFRRGPAKTFSQIDDTYSNNRLVCGALLPGVQSIPNRPDVFAVHRSTSRDIGFRCVRSVRPRYLDQAAP